MSNVKMLGHEFKPMTQADWESFAGADEGSLICYCADEQTVLVLSPNGRVTEMCWDDKGHDTVDRDWDIVADRNSFK